MQETDNLDVNIDDYIEKNLELSEYLAGFLEMITLLMKEDTSVRVEKLDPEEFSEETDKEIYGIELSISLLLSHEGYGKSEIFLFANEEDRDKFYLYLDKIINS